jgi:hypothetical protein
VHEKRLEELKRKIQRVLSEAGRGAMIAKVEEITVMPRPGLLYGLIQLLDLLSSSLTHINFQTIDPNILSSERSDPTITASMRYCIFASFLITLR